MIYLKVVGVKVSLVELGSCWMVLWRMLDNSRKTEAVGGFLSRQFVLAILQDQCDILTQVDKEFDKGIIRDSSDDGRE